MIEGEFEAAEGSEALPDIPVSIEVAGFEMILLGAQFGREPGIIGPVDLLHDQTRAAARRRLDADDSGNLAFAADAGGFVAAIDWLLADAGSRQRMGMAGRRTFEARYTWDAVWRKLAIDLRPA